ncbi:DUF2332 domain-containing protein [Salinarimonas ramus]|nr:DUF2332 family protein [Salinarimonas ramus]
MSDDEAAREAAIRASFAGQADLCAELGSDFTGRVLRAFIAVAERESAFGAAVLSWPGRPDARNDALPLRVSAALHGLARSGRAPALGALYPPAPSPSEAALREALAAAIAADDEALVGWLAHAPQTNEVARSACLVLGLMQVSARTGLPVRLFEIGSSGGLNLLLDRYAYRFAGRRYGAAGTPLLLAPEWSGSDRVGREPIIVERLGCDLSPVDLLDPAARERLTAYVWPDQSERLARIEAALALATEAPPRVEKADAADFVSRRVRPRDGTATVLMHSIVWGYVPDAGREAITRHMEEVGAAATSEAPLAWIAFELDETLRPVLTLRLWPGGETTVLAHADPHVRRIDWRL